MHDRTGRIKEVAVGTAGELAQILRQRFTRERPRRQNGDRILRR